MHSLQHYATTGRTLNDGQRSGQGRSKHRFAWGFGACTERRVCKLHRTVSHGPRSHVRLVVAVGMRRRHAYDHRWLWYGAKKLHVACALVWILVYSAVGTSLRVCF